MNPDSSRDPNPELSEAVEDLLDGRLTRKDFVKRATVLGLSVGAIGSILAACGGDDSAAPAPAEPAAPAEPEPPAPAPAEPEPAPEPAPEPPPEEPPAAAEKPYDGQKVRMVVVAEGEDQAVAEQVDVIKDLYGIDLELTPLVVGPLIEKENQSLKADEGSFDVVNMLGFTVAQLVGGGFMDPLQPYLDDPAKTPADFDFDDFFAGQAEYVGFFDIENQQFGGDDLYLIPGLSAGTILMYYRKDLFDAAGLAPPTNWDEYLAAAEALNQDGVAGNSMIAKSGDVSMFLVDWYTRFATLGGQLMTGTPSDQNFTPNLTSPEGVAALQHMVDCVPFAPDGVLQYDFTASTDAFAAGNTALMLMWSSIAGPVYSPDTSKVSDVVDVAITPGVGDNAGKAVRGGWGLGIPSNAQNKDAAWQVITHLSSPDFLNLEMRDFGKDSSRRSTYSDPEFVAELPYLPVLGQQLETVQILEIALIPEAFELITIAAEEFSAALNGSSSAEDALQSADGKWIEVLERGGYLV